MLICEMVFSDAFIAILLLASMHIGCRHVDATYNFPGVDDQKSVKQGDINIGVITTVYDYDAMSPCSDHINKLAMQRVQAVISATQRINANSRLLANVTLGYVILDACAKDSTALALAIGHLLPSDGRNQSVCPADRDDVVDVVGIVGPPTSGSSIAVANLMSLVGTPVLSPTATSDELSDRVRFPTFLRMIPPDMHQAAAMISVLRMLNWTYVSLVYSASAYSRNGAQQVNCTCKHLHTGIETHARKDKDTITHIHVYTCLWCTPRLPIRSLLHF